MGFEEHAYERTIIAEIQRWLMDQYIQTEQQPKKPLICEEVSQAKSHVPQSVFLTVWQKLHIWENTQRAEMDKYSYVKTEPGADMAFLRDPGPVKFPEGMAQTCLEGPHDDQQEVEGQEDPK